MTDTTTWKPVKLPTSPILRSQVDEYSLPGSSCPVCEAKYPVPCASLDCGTFEVDDLGPNYVYTPAAMA